MPSSHELTFFEKIRLELKTLFSHAPGWEASAAATLTYMAPMVESILSLTDPTAVPALIELVSRIQAAMAAASVLIKASEPTPTLVKYLSAINTDAGEIESLAGVKNPQSAAKLSGIVTVITSEINALLSEAGGTAPIS